MRTTVRATRSYMAGLGTSGSLLAGAALLFVLGSAIVAFRGWPQIAAGPATTSVTPAAAHPAVPSRTARRLAAVLRRQATVAAPAGRAGGAGRRGASNGHVRVRTGVLGATAPGRGAPGRGVPTAGAASAGSGSGACGGSCTNPQGLVTRLTNTVSQQVTKIGSDVGSGIGSGSSAVAGPVGGISPPAGNAVQNAGSTLGSAVSGATTTAASTLTQAGSALGSGH
ncbi:MAG TPA: hypothetical protein VMD09_11280 [Solirubrobacteraceae bacterium]|nr:hypothetical protein [Solirubrobacteraceae bacterium]